MQIKDFKLREAMPSDKPHLLLWDKFDQHQLRSLAYFDDAEVGEQVVADDGAKPIFSLMSGSVSSVWIYSAVSNPT